MAEAFRWTELDERAELTVSWNIATGQKKLPEYRSEDLGSPAPPYVGLDRTRIPATPDCLVKDSVGLYTAVLACRDVIPKRMPMQTVGDRIEPACMSHGRALQMFGPPADPGRDPLPPGEATTQGQVMHVDTPDNEQVSSDQETDISEAMSRTSVADDETATKPSVDKPEVELPVEPVVEPNVERNVERTTEDREPQTEREYRDKHFSPTKPCSDLDAWKEIMGARKFGLYLPILCKQYVELVRAKENQTAVFGYEGWPAVDGMDFEGFVNWVIRCKASDPTFKATVQQWNISTDDRVEELETKITTAKVIDNFNDAKLRLGDATDYYRGEKAILQRDWDKMGIAYFNPDDPNDKPKPRRKQYRR